jgi:tetratricopeptide (TPR) repeat protein
MVRTHRVSLGHAMQSKTLFLTLLAASLSACAQMPDWGPGSRTDSSVVLAQATSDGQPEPVPFTPQLMYQFLLGEIAGQRGELRLSAEAYSDLAARTRDVRVARRATELALYARQGGLALRNARLWLELEPDSVKAQQTLASLLVGAGQLAEARPYLERWLQSGAPEQVFMQLHSLFARTTDRQAVATLVSDLAAAYPALAEARFAVGQAAWQAGQGGNALSALDDALRLKPEWEHAALFRAQVLQQKESDAAAIDFLESYLKARPGAAAVRMAYAKQLARAGRLEESRQSFALLAEAEPTNPEPHFALGLVAMQANELDTARSSFLKALDLDYPESSVVRYYLGQIAEAKGALEQSLEWYKSVGGVQAFDAGLRAGMVMGRMGRMEEARSWLARLTVGNEAQAVRLVQADAELLRDAKRYEEAFQVFDAALSRHVDNLDLLYDRAMVAEKLGRLDALERDLRRMIQLKPDYAHAYNALGYTLADRTNRLKEAIELLEKAIALAPDDPFIQDSMGWALYKAKRYPEAAVYLRKAYAARPDPEIAAHLGEVLWMLGEKEEAQRIWQGGLKSFPDNESLRETLSRLAP